MCRNLLVDQFVEAKRTKEEELVADVHSLSAGEFSVQWYQYCLQHVYLLQVHPLGVAEVAYLMTISTFSQG